MEAASGDGALSSRGCALGRGCQRVRSCGKMEEGPRSSCTVMRVVSVHTGDAGMHSVPLSLSALCTLHARASYLDQALDIDIG
eukprot:scaffold14964_cov146-Isochrysis_galbana.AAC.2